MMIRLCLVLLLSASVFTESVRETETWMPMKTTQAVASTTTTRDDKMEASGDFSNGSDFGFPDDEDDGDIADDDEEDDFSGSGDEEVPHVEDFRPSIKPGVIDNKIPEQEKPVPPTVNEMDIVKNNEVLLRKSNPSEENPSNVLMSRGDDNIFHKTEVLAALIAGGAVGLMFAVLLILLLIYRMKKKDEGSYDLGKKPIYKKAPTTEIYA